MATGDRTADTYSQIGFSIRRSGIGGEVHSRRHSVAALYPAARSGPRAFLAVRLLGPTAKLLRGCQGLSHVTYKFTEHFNGRGAISGVMVVRKAVDLDGTFVNFSKNVSPLR